MYNYTSANVEEQNYWISYTDLVTGFMIIFIILTLILFNRQQEKITVEAKYKELSNVFKTRLDSNIIEITDYATIRFTAKEGQPLFEKTEYYPTPYFKELLDQFIPIYFSQIDSIVFQDTSRVVSIKELRIEGHTDSDSDYLSNLRLSSNRALKVQRHILENKSFQRLNGDFKDFIRKSSIAVGYSESQLLDENGDLVEISHKPENQDYSRRVEFRILLEKKAQ
ncbi:MAG: hypothetical protein AAGJ18_00285 [Bacteroidota bacterium]